MATIPTRRGGRASLPPAPPKIIGWEYEEEFLRHDTEWMQTLNQYGAKGWELVAVIHDESESDPLQVHAVFKRPIYEEVLEDGNGGREGE